MKHITIATRASKLALAQTGIVKKLLEKLSPNTEISIITTSTKGDRDKSDLLYKTESIRLFTTQVEKLLLTGRADIAVHSLKDLPTKKTASLNIAAIPMRESVADVLVSSEKIGSIIDLPSGASVGTSSLRRIAQLHHLRKDINCVPLRGNIETRIKKVESHQVDAAVVACAGLKRLGLEEKISTILNPEQFFTAPGQGALAVQARDKDTELIEFVAQLNHKSTRIAVQAERYILAAMHGGCSIPLGVYSKISKGEITINATITSLDGTKCIKRSRTARIENIKPLAKTLAQELLNAGGKEILQQIRLHKN